MAFKEDTMWGVTDESDDGLAGKNFGTFKTEFRMNTEEKLRDYMCEPSATRSKAGDTRRNFKIAVSLAPPGSGKSRLLDDAVRAPLVSHLFAHILRLAITFNGVTSGAYKYAVSARLLREFFCGAVAEDADVAKLLSKFDTLLSAQFKDKSDAEVAPEVVSAIEALYFGARGGKLGRTVLMFDEISQAIVDEPTNNTTNEEFVNRIIAATVDRAALSHKFGRRGAVITALKYIKPLSEISGSGRDLLWLPLGTFDVWSGAAQAAIAEEARGLGLLEPDQFPHQCVWSLLAATGGRPRDILGILDSAKDADVEFGNPHPEELIGLLFVTEPSPIFRRYLLPSMLDLPMELFESKDVMTQFGMDATDSGLLNADQFATKTESAVPAVSLRHALVFARGCVLRKTMRLLIAATAFLDLNGTGKDFEHVWVLLVFAHLLLQHNVRVGSEAANFWPHRAPGDAELGPERPTVSMIDVFQKSSRIEALFRRPFDAVRIHNELVIDRQIRFVGGREPTLAIWDDLWVSNVVAGSLVRGWSMATYDVVWRPSTVVYFSKSTMAAIDFMLLVGDANGTGDARPHVYMFQCKALADPLTEGTPSSKAVTVSSIVSGVQKKLATLFTDGFAGHVLRRAGISSAAQVTLCINALQFGTRVDASQLTAAFSVVLFDESDFRALGGAAFANTWFFRHIAQLSSRQTAAN